MFAVPDRGCLDEDEDRTNTMASEPLAPSEQPVFEPAADQKRAVELGSAVRCPR